MKILHINWFGYQDGRELSPVKSFIAHSMNKIILFILKALVTASVIAVFLLIAKLIWLIIKA